MEKKKLSKSVERLLLFIVRRCANSTSSGTMFQPTVPVKLQNYISFNDK